MKKSSASADREKSRSCRQFFRKWCFFLLVVAVYGALVAVEPERTFHALKESLHVLLQIALPIMIALAMMFAANLIIERPQVVQLLSKGAGLKGILLSLIAGMFSMGPIYAWYPLLRSLREQGASDFHIANFLSCRSVKPILLPVMIYYFGWICTLVLNLLIVLGSPVVALITNATIHWNKAPNARR